MDVSNSWMMYHTLAPLYFLVTLSFEFRLQ